jgi:predicted ATPase
MQSAEAPKPPTQIRTGPQLDRFREKVTAARRQAGRLQKDLAAALGLDAHVLSRKLNGISQARLTHEEVKTLIKTLAAWDAIVTQAEAIDLLELMRLKPESFTAEEWKRAPLNRLAQEAAPAPAPAPPPLALLRPASGALPVIPVPPTSLIGRADAIGAICDRLRQPGVRLLTLLGTGGVGKTRLALAVARELVEAFPDGVCFVSLGAILDPALVASAMLEALRLLEDEPTGTTETTAPTHARRLHAFFRKKRALLVLDNFEQVLSAAPLIGDLLEAAPDLKVLVTSRAVLHLYGEHEWVVPPLDFCNPAALPNLAHLQDSAAVKLFVERAQAVQPAFTLTPANAAAVAEICARLDGLPLAIELAAARIRLLSPAQVLERLGGSHLGQPQRVSGPLLTFLQQGARNVPPRQHTLVSTLAWSEQLLAPAEQRLFAQVGVFLDGWTLEAAQAICLDGACPPEALLDLLESLVSQSLVVPMPTDAPGLGQRFGLLETIREYARQRLRARGEQEQTAQRHAGYFLALAKQREPDLHGGAGQAAALRLLEREQGNLRAALTWAITGGQAEMAQRLCGALSQFWQVRTQFREAEYWCEAAAQLAQHTPPLVRAKLLLTRGQLLVQAPERQAIQQAQGFLLDSLALYEAAGDQQGRAEVLATLGTSWYFQGDFAQARACYQESLALYRASGHALGVAITLSRLGGLLTFQGERAAARQMLMEAATFFRASGERVWLLFVYAHLGILAVFEEDPQEALAHLRAALALALELGQQGQIAKLLTIFGVILIAAGTPAHAARVCGAAEALLGRIGDTLAPVHRPFYRASLEQGKAALGEAAWAARWAEGSALSLEQALEMALEGYEQAAHR